VSGDPIPTLLISGASRGLGLEFVRQYAAAGWRVHATCRDPAQAVDLQAVQGDVTIHPLEVTDKAALDRLVAELKQAPLDLVVANAGVTGPRGMEPELIDRESWMETLAVDTIAPLALVGAFKENLKKGRRKLAVALSSRLGSIGEDTTGGLYAYRSAKAGLNAAWKALAIDWQSLGIICVVLNPGWVRTGMGGPRADLAPEESVAGLRAVIDGLTLQSSGHFLGWDGSEIPW
jgi:NAD(P)-dependent dehydrogenase (short-subunit alcohol dehydrogenase family)